jgi:RNA polymerase sigma-70 factor (sigma-E family)
MRVCRGAPFDGEPADIRVVDLRVEQDASTIVAVGPDGREAWFSEDLGATWVVLSARSGRSRQRAMGCAHPPTGTAGRRSSSSCWERLIKRVQRNGQWVQPGDVPLPSYGHTIKADDLRNKGGVRVSDTRSDFVEFAASRRPELRRFAYALCGDWHTADDIVQVALSRLYRAWPRIHRAAAEDAYARRIVANAAIDQSRRPSRREQPVAEHVDHATPLLARQHDLDGGLDVLKALDGLAHRQRQVVVMRHWLDLSVEETAAALRISEGTVKSQTARALARLRDLLDETSDERTRA